MFNQKRLTEFLFDPVKETFIKYINPKYGYGNVSTVNDDVIQYIKENVLSLYKIKDVQLYVKTSRENTPLTYTTAELDDAGKLSAGLGITTAFSTSLLNTNLFDLKLIYNKRTGFTESFGFSVTLVKK
jgi:hypothetical protein